MLLALPLIFSSQTAEPFETPKLFLLLTVALALWTERCLSGVPLARSAPLTWAGWAAVCSALISTVFSVHWPSSVWGAPDSWAGLGLVLGTVTIFFAAQRLSPVSSLWRWAVVAASAVVTGYGLIQLLELDPLEWTRTATWCERVRPFSTLGHPNGLAGYLAMAVPLALVSCVSAWRHQKRWLAVCSLTVALMASGIVFATLSRAGWLALALGWGVTLVGLSRSGRWVQPRVVVPLLILAAAAALVNAPASVMSRLKTFFEAPSRRFIYEAAGRIFLDHPLTGSGLDTFQLAFQRHRAPGYWQHEWGATPQRAHNDFLHLLATQGLLGGVVAVVGLALVLKLIQKAWRSEETEVRLYAAGLTGSLAAAGVHAMFGFHVASTAVLAAFVLGQLVAVGHIGSGIMVTNPSGSIPAGHLFGRVPRAVKQGLTLALIGVGGFWLVACPLLASVAARRAERLEALGGWPAAINAHREATKWMPFADTAWARLGVAQQASAARSGEEPRSAEESFRRAVSLSPTNAYHHANLGRFIARVARDTTAEEKRLASAAAYDTALRLDSHNALLALDAIETAVVVGDLPRARRLVEQLLGDYPDLGPAWSWLGFISQAEARLEEARAFLQNAVNADWHGDSEGRRIAFRRLDAVLRAEGLTAEADAARLQSDVATAEPGPSAGCRE